MIVLWLVLLCSLVISTETSKYHQNDYTITVQIVELVDYNKAVNASAYLRTELCMNFKYHQNDYTITVQIVELVDYNKAVNASAYLHTELCMNFKVAKSNNSTTKSQWLFSQSDYDVKWEIAEITACNYSYFRDPKADMVPFNRTLRVFNASFQLLQVLSKDLKLDVQVYKFMSNEYRFFPITVSVSPCVEYDLNGFNVKNILRNISNIHSCPLQKGLYYIRNGLPDYSYLPPHFPRGQYKMTTIWYHKSDFLGELDLYGTIKDKPSKW